MNTQDSELIVHWLKLNEELIHKFNKLEAENTRYREALEKIQSLTFSWVMNKDNVEDILLVVAPIREKCREALKGK